MRILGKAKPYPSEMLKITQNELKSKINEIAASISDTDERYTGEIKLIKSNIESVKNSLALRIKQTNVSFHQ